MREVCIIGNGTKEEPLKQYSEQFIYKKIERQFVLNPKSLSRTETYFVREIRVFYDAIIHNALSVN